MGQSSAVLDSVQRGREVVKISVSRYEDFFSPLIPNRKEVDCSEEAREVSGKFQAETRVIGKAHHSYLVRLLGFCEEGSIRLLVYEYMSNGSLGNLIFVAQAKLLMPDQTRTVTVVRGTRGYLAPEWNKNVPISVKADVYSYGIVLEILCCRRSMEVYASEPEAVLLSGWAYKCFITGKLNKLCTWEVVNDKTAVESMVKVALWCIQDEPYLRPTMKSVVLMLEGVTDIAIPPSPASDST
ncbi:unnamed protein product [Sphenostylis stenocarpa]|uniref:Protein kinase domain-containing protein n=1 Tax=Sphenostylis stenocarpa TaxID=92480 RepID=A0AA86VXX9_9FABA|nr:unnamed protein product [Sphenostylis stenocarpa]